MSHTENTEQSFSVPNLNHFIIKFLLLNNNENNYWMSNEPGKIKPIYCVHLSKPELHLNRPYIPS